MFGSISAPPVIALPAFRISSTSSSYVAMTLAEFKTWVLTL